MIGIVPTLAMAHRRGRDLVWCASLDLGWRALADFVGIPLALAEDDEEDGGDGGAAELVRALAASPVTPADVDPASYVAHAGHDDAAWAARVAALLDERFGAHDATLAAHAPAAGRVAAYAYLQKSWTFALPFERLHGWTRFRDWRVDSFSLGSRFDVERYQRRARQVLVHHHAALPIADDAPDDAVAEEFVIELVTGDPRDQLVIARLEPRATLHATAAWAMARLRDDVATAPDAHPTLHDQFAVPCLDFDGTRRYHELDGARLGGGVTLGEVRQRVRLRLDEGGARLVSEAELRGLSLAPRALVCDGPFLLLALRRGARTPFLAVWVESDALLLNATPLTPR